MNIKWMLLLFGSATGIAFTAALVHTANLQSMAVTNLTGNLVINQDLPLDCDNLIQTTRVAGGRLVLAPAEGIDVAGGKLFALTRANVSFAPFTLQGSCAGESETRHYTHVSVQLVRAVSFTAVPAGGGVYNVRIPKEDFVLYQSAFFDGLANTGKRKPIEDVTGTIDLTLGIVTMHIVMGTKIHLEAGCVPVLGCLFSDDYNGTLTADLSGSIAFPDADGDLVPDRTDTCRFVPNPDQSIVPPTPTITAPPAVTLASCAGHSIGVASAADVCDGGPVSVTSNAPGTFAVGANVVTWRAEDTRGRAATSSQTVTVVDTTKPVFTFIPPDLTVNNCGRVALGVPTATDDCAGSPRFTNNAPEVFRVGTTSVTWKARDKAGNTSTAVQRVTVHDTVAPKVSCVSTGHPKDIFRVSASDACCAPTIRLGSFALSNREKIKITETGKPGIRLVNVIGPEHIKHFHVPKSGAVITATDGSGNVASTVCRPGDDHDHDDDDDHDGGDREGRERWER